MLLADLSSPPETWRLLLGLVILALGVIAVYRQVEVRLTLLITALALGIVADDPWRIVQVFFQTFANERFVVPICTAMGFAYVLRHTGCDQHLVRLLVRPLTRVRFLLIPGTVLVGFLVNMPIVSQTSTAVTIGPVVIPILLAARISPLTTGAALLLGSSIGGELFNPGAPELRTTIEESVKAAKDLKLPYEQYNTERCVERIMPLNLVGLVVATSVFWWLSLRREQKVMPATGATPAAGPATDQGPTEEIVGAPFHVNYLRAMVPLVPLVLLYLTAPPMELIEVPKTWLEPQPEAAPPGRFESRLIGAAMLVGTVVAGLVVWRKGLGTASAFFEGAGFGFTHIISLIIVANCFGEAVKAIGLAQVVGGWIRQDPVLLIVAAAVLPLGFAFLSGSGMASTQSLFVFFAEPALRLGIDPTHAGAVVSIASAAGRTMSPVAAVALMSARLTGTTSLELSRRVALPLLAGVGAVVIAALVLSPRP